MSEVPAKFADGARTIPTPPALPALPTEENSLGYVDHPTSSTSTRELADGGWTTNEDLDPECPMPPRETVCEFELTDGRRRVGWYVPNIWVEAFHGPTHLNGDVVRYRPLTSFAIGGAIPPEPLNLPASSPPVESGVDEIRALCEAATPGPWFVVEQPWNDGLPFIVSGSPDPHHGRFVCDLEDMSAGAFEVDAVVEGGLSEPNGAADGAFIAAARTAVPSLLAENEGLTRYADRMQAAAMGAARERDDIFEELKVITAERERALAEVERLRAQVEAMRTLGSAYYEFVPEFCCVSQRRESGYTDLCRLPADHEGEHFLGDSPFGVGVPSVPAPKPTEDVKR